MGKRLQNTQSKQKKAEFRKMQEEAQKKRTRKTVIISLGALLLTAVLVTGGIFAGQAFENLYADSGRSYRNKEVFKTEHLKVDAAMLSYCFYDYLYENGVLESQGVKKPDDLKNMTFESGGKDTYYTYYVQLTASRMESALLFAEAALSKGKVLGEKENTFIQAKLDAIEYRAESQGMEVKDYIFANYGRGVKMSDIQKVLEIRALSDMNMGELYNAQTASDEEIRTYISENDDLKYYRVDYYIFDFIIGTEDTDEKNQKLHDEAYAKAELLAACKTAEEFEEVCRRFFKEEYADDTDFSDTDLEALVNSCKVTGRAISKNAEGTVDKWLFDFARKEGETLAVDGKKSVGAVFMLKPAYSVDQPQKAVRAIEIDFNNYVRTSDAIAAMKNIQTLYESGEKTEQAFAALAEKHSEDFLNAPNGGYIADTYSDNSAFNRLISSWLEKAEEGDVNSFTDETGMYLVYCTGKGETRSVIDARAAIKSQKYRDETKTYYDLYPFEATMDHVGIIAPLVTG